MLSIKLVGEEGRWAIKTGEEEGAVQVSKDWYRDY